MVRGGCEGVSVRFGGVQRRRAGGVWVRVEGAEGGRAWVHLSHGEM